MELAPLLQAIAKTENIAILILVVINLYLMKALVQIRKEDREDRQKQDERYIAVQQRNNEVLEKLADTITQMRVTLASRGYTQ